MTNHIQIEKNTSVGKCIRQLRRMQNLSQADVAMRSGISIPALSKIETGVTEINLSILEQITQLFEVSVISLLNEYIIESEFKDIENKFTKRENEIENLCGIN